MAKARRRWLGGFIRRTKSGRDVYVIERWDRGRGRKILVSTGCSTKAGALEELARFEKDPLRYRPGGDTANALRLTKDLVDRYRAHQRELKLSAEWIDQVAHFLADWMEALAGRDLRATQLADLDDILDGWKAKGWGSIPGRIKAIKGVCHWLRKKGKLTRDQDPTMDLAVPQPRPEKQRRKKVVAPQVAQTVFDQLGKMVRLKVAPMTRDLMDLASATGWHITEIHRFNSDGEILEVQPLKEGDPIAVLITKHKSGDEVKTPILWPEHLEVAKRIKAAKKIPHRVTTARHIRWAIDEIRAQQEADGVPEEQRMPRFILGAMRHNVLSWGVKKGARVEDASEFANHRSKQTTKRFYLDVDVPTASIPVERFTKKG